MKDPNRIARIEQAVAKKYGTEAVDNPRRYWNDTKEESYQEQIKEVAKKELLHRESEEKEEVDGILVSKKLLNRETTKRSCPVRNIYSFSLKDDAYMSKYDCCYNCFIQWVEGREDRWLTGWRPPKGDE